MNLSVKFNENKVRCFKRKLRKRRGVGGVNVRIKKDEVYVRGKKMKGICKS